MKIITRQGILRTELFKEVMLHERVGSIAFCYAYSYEEDGEGATEFQIQVPMTFRSYREARRAFRKYLRARNGGEDSVSFLEFRCPWPRKTYREIIKDKNRTLSDYDTKQKNNLYGNGSSLSGSYRLMRA